MYSIIVCQDSQYKVQAGDKILVDKLSAKVGEKISSDKVLLVVADDGQVKIGAPYVSGASYEARVERQFKDKKVMIFKKRRRHNYRRKKGHRQELSEITILNIKH